MPRQKRFFIPGSYYHIIARGNKKEHIFLDDNDFNFFLFLLQKNWEKKPLNILAFSLMSNHLHLLVKASAEPLSSYFQPVLTTYAIYFNRKYQKTGHVFEDRFKSFLIDSDDYLYEVFRYILLNPVRAYLTKDLSTYKWTSFYYFYHQDKAQPFMDFSIFFEICPDGSQNLESLTIFLAESLIKEQVWPSNLDDHLQLFHLQYLARKICKIKNIDPNSFFNSKYKNSVVDAQIEFALQAKEQFNIEMKQIANFLGKDYRGFLKTIRTRKNKQK